MVSNIPSLLFDLLEIAAYIYCADQRASRGTDTLSQAGAAWRRSMHFTIPVRNPDVWSGSELQDALRKTIGFLSDDTYEFTFVRADEPFAENDAYFEQLSDQAGDIEEVALFSGGLDSFAGAIEFIVANGHRTALVGHHSSPKVFAAQKALFEHLKHAVAPGRVQYVPVNITNCGVQATEYTQRTRSFLYASLAYVIARMFGKGGFTFFENGIVSFNLPIAQDVLGGRATRTTHPKVIRGFAEIFSLLAEEPIEVRTPYIWLTKRDIVERIVQQGFGHLIGGTVSCAHPMQWTKEVRHCGVCSQCIDRRFAILSARAGEYEPESNYELDLLTGDRSLHEELRMAVAYVKFCQTIDSCQCRQFDEKFPQVAAALSFFPELSNDAARDQIFDLHRRHARDVLSVISAGLVSEQSAVVRSTLPPGSLLSLCLSRATIPAPPTNDVDRQLADFMDRLDTPVCMFAVDEEAQSICLGGEFWLEGANFKLFKALLPHHRSAKASMSEVPFIEAWKLANELGVDEQSLRQRVTRLRREVSDRLAVDQGIILEIDDFIENRAREGYRLAPALCEVSCADLVAPTA
ncbi:7-cyano-7-deazaguanine synthase [Hoeflea sp. Naph1]|uniref:7-cyano-7-deazaguanine synthase n=1 Tax=Hoeflea sp. Naph1 TaxID=3388653 RepID=UPI00398FD091